MKLGNPSIGKLKKGDRIGPFTVRDTDYVFGGDRPVCLEDSRGVGSHWLHDSITDALIECYGVEREDKWEPTGAVIKRKVVSSSPTTGLVYVGTKEPGVYRYIEERLVQ